MNIYGLKYLDKNDYNSISIDEGIISVSSNAKMSTIPVGRPFRESLKGLDDESKVNEVIDYFLRNNRLTFINDCSFCIVVGNENRLLKFKVNPTKENKSKIFNKYLADRSETLLSIPVDTYIIDDTSKMSSYSIINGDTMRFVLASKEHKYLDFERRFLKELLGHVFDDEAHIKTIYHKDEDGNDTKEVDGVFIIGEHPRGSRIRVNHLNNEIKMAVISHNTRIRKEKEENETAKKMQLKMEGF